VADRAESPDAQARYAHIFSKGAAAAGHSPVDAQVLMAGDYRLDGRVSYLKFPVPVLPANEA
jgi:hypothetical protein